MYLLQAPNCSEICIVHTRYIALTTVFISVIIFIICLACSKLCEKCKKKDIHVHIVNERDSKDSQQKRKEDNDSILPKVPKGFPNMGNTCYMNAILQNLVWTPLIDRCLSKGKCNRAETALFNLIEYTHNGPGDIVDGKLLHHLLNAAREHNSQFCGYHQQDSFEMYNTLIGGIQDEKLCCKPKKKNSQDLEHKMEVCPLTRLFGGVFMTVYQYQSCSHVELNFQMFTSISIPVPKQTEEQLKEKNKSEVQNDDKQNDKDNVIDLARNQKHSEEKLENLEKLHVDVSPGKKEPNDRQEGNKEEVTVFSRNVTPENIFDNKRAQESIGRFNALQENGVRGGEEQMDNHISENEGESHKKQEMEGYVTDLSRNILHVKDNPDQTEQLEASSQQGDQNVKKESFHTFSEGKNQDNLIFQSGSGKEKQDISVPPTKHSEKLRQTVPSGNEGDTELNQEKQGNFTATLDHKGHIKEQQTIKNNYEEKTNQYREKSITFTEMNMPSTSVAADDTISGQNDPTSFSMSPESKEDEVYFKPLQEANTEKPLTGIELGLTELTRIEEFHEEIFSCTKCTAKDLDNDVCVKTLKKLFVITPPPVLVLQINRFMQEGRELRKIHTKVSFSEILNISTYCSAAYKVTEQCSENTNTTVLYNLYGVVAHRGTLSGGHYVAYVKTTRRDQEKILEQVLNNGSFKDPEHLYKEKNLAFFKSENVHKQANDESVPSTENETQEIHNEDKSAWYYISDDWVREIKKQEVFEISDAYILFYERIR